MATTVDPRLIHPTSYRLIAKAIEDEGGETLPTGTERQVVSFDGEGTPIATELTADMWSEFPNGAPTQGIWLAAFEPGNPVGTPDMGFAEVSLTADANTIPIRNAEGNLVVGVATQTGEATTLGQVTTLLAGKANTTHTHTVAQITGLQAALDGKQASGDYAPTTHTHTIAQVTGLQSALDGKQVAGSYATSAQLNALIARVEALEQAAQE